MGKVASIWGTDGDKTGGGILDWWGWVVVGMGSGGGGGGWSIIDGHNRDREGTSSSGRRRGLTTRVNNGNTTMNDG